MNNSAATRRITSIAIEYNGNDLGKAEAVYSKNLLGKTPEERFQEMRMIAERNPKVKKWALTGYISPPKEVGDKLPNQELKEIALESLKKVGLTEQNQVILDIHNSTKQKHIHFIVNRMDVHGKCTVKAANIGKLFGESVRKVCKERNLKTDVELGKEKKALMFQALQDCLKAARNFDELLSKMADKEYRVTLSQNVKVGVSGLRIVHFKDINNETERVYAPGFKLSEVTSKLKIADIKNILSGNMARNKIENVASEAPVEAASEVAPEITPKAEPIRPAVLWPDPSAEPVINRPIRTVRSKVTLVQMIIDFLRTVRYVRVVHEPPKYKDPWCHVKRYKR